MVRLLRGGGDEAVETASVGVVHVLPSLLMLFIVCSSRQCFYAMGASRETREGYYGRKFRSRISFHANQRRSLSLDRLRC